ncbi:hypothetical protein ACJW30_03G018400 [Castanea mollissima]
MKTVLLVVVACGLLLLCIEVDAKRILLEEVINGATDVKPNNQPEESSSMGNPISGSVPTVDANNENTASNSSDKANKSEDDKNESYGSYGNPSGSSTESHHTYNTECPPNRKSC